MGSPTPCFSHGVNCELPICLAAGILRRSDGSGTALYFCFRLLRLPTSKRDRGTPRAHGRQFSPEKFRRRLRCWSNITIERSTRSKRRSADSHSLAPRRQEGESRALPHPIGLSIPPLSRVCSERRDDLPSACDTGGPADAGRGGNAIDAALAAAIALVVVEPTGNGFGSDAFCILWDGKELHGLNASGRSSADWTPERFAGRAAMPLRGWESVTVPGAVSAWVDLSRRFGRLPFTDLFAPAVDYAERGFHVTPVIAEQWRRAAMELHTQPGFREGFMPNGSAPRPVKSFAIPISPAPSRRSPRAERRGVLPRCSGREDRGFRAPAWSGLERERSCGAYQRLVRHHLAGDRRRRVARDTSKRTRHRRFDDAGYFADASTSAAWVRTTWMRFICRSRR